MYATNRIVDQRAGALGRDDLWTTRKRYR